VALCPISIGSRATNIWTSGNRIYLGLSENSIAVFYFNAQKRKFQFVKSTGRSIQTTSCAISDQTTSTTIFSLENKSIVKCYLDKSKTDYEYEIDSEDRIIRENLIECFDFNVNEPCFRIQLGNTLINNPHPIDYESNQIYWNNNNKSIIYCISIYGTIYSFARISHQRFSVMSSLQRLMENHIESKPFFGTNLMDYRTNGKHSGNIVDGVFLWQFYDLTPSTKSELVEEINQKHSVRFDIKQLETFISNASNQLKSVY
jgi:hypothetical protein